MKAALLLRRQYCKQRLKTLIRTKQVLLNVHTVDARDARHWFVPFGKRVRTGIVKDTCGGNSALLHKKGSQMGWIKRKKVEKQNDRP